MSCFLGGAGRVLADRNFRLYFAGNAASVLGFWVYRAALGWLTWKITESTTWLGIIGFAGTAPAVFLAPLAGALGDRMGLKRLAMIALAFNGLISLAFAALAFADLINIYVILGATIAHGAAVAFDLPARIALIPDLISDRSTLSSAIALNSTTFHAGAFIGPGVFALFNAFLDISWSFLFHGLSYCFYLLCFALIRLAPAAPHQGPQKGLFDDIVEGLSYVRRHKGMLSLFMLAGTSHLLLRPYTDLLPGFSAEVFGRGAEGYATMLSAIGAGALVSGVWLSGRGKVTGLVRIMIASIFATAGFLVLFSLSDIFWLALVCMFATGFFLLAAAVSNQSLTQHAVDQEVRGRVISLSTAMAMGFPALGVLLLGWVAEVTGVQTAVLGASVVTLFLLIWLARRLGRVRAVLEVE